MSSPKLAELVERLYKLTRAGSLEWAEGAGRGVVFVALPSFSVSLYPQGVDYVIEILGNDGSVLEAVKDPQLNPYMTSPYSMMAEMYALARRRAQGVDAAIDQLLDELPDA